MEVVNFYFFSWLNTNFLEVNPIVLDFFNKFMEIWSNRIRVIGRTIGLTIDG